MGRKPNPKPDDAEQSKRFVKAVKELEADDAEALDRAFKVVRSNHGSGATKRKPGQ